MVPRHSIKCILSACLLLTSCGSFTSDVLTPSDQTQDTPVSVVSPPVESETPQSVTSPTAAPDYVNQIRNAEYQLGLPDSLQIVQLTDGKFEQGVPGGADFISVTVTDFVTRGDLNGDDEDEIAALIAENFGGTGTFVFLAIYADVDGKLTFQTSKLIDDRPQLNALSIENNEIFLDATTHASEDPMCCPTLKTTRHFHFIDGQLDMTDYTTFTPDGRPRTITITSPESGTITYSSVQVRGDVAIAPFENNLIYRIYDVGGVELSSGAISVSAPDLGAPGTFDTVIPIRTVLSGAVIRIEVQDISAADGSLIAMDSVELVVQ
jgi:Immunoglobulin-like domain of bacterial spore germination